MGKGIFVTGTGTDVGKTYVTGLIIKKIKENGMTPGSVSYTHLVFLCENSLSAVRCRLQSHSK